MSRARIVPRSPLWNTHPPKGDDYTADDFRHLREHIEMFWQALHPGSMAAPPLTDELRALQTARRERESEREEAATPPIRVYTFTNRQGHGVMENNCAGFVWVETEYPEEGSVGVFPTRAEAEAAAAESGSQDWTVVPISHAQLRERELEQRIEDLADADDMAADAIAAIRLHESSGPMVDREMQDSIRAELTRTLGAYPKELRDAIDVGHRRVWEMLQADRHGIACARVRRLALAHARNKAARDSVSMSGELPDKGPLIDNAKAKEIIPWEPVGQCTIDDLPDVAPDSHPAPWTRNDRGNGHVDIFAANGQQVAHVHLWINETSDDLDAKLAKVNGDGE